ncbi:MAG: Holliday junction resolvase RecU [Bacilli bacterium]
MKYPSGIKKVVTNNSNKATINYGNRGMNLESDLNITNEYYRDHDIAYIYKKPTPIKIGTVDYKIMKITEAYFESPSTTDYNGLFNGKYIDFEAKETNNKTLFPIRNIHKHQLTHLENIYKHQGICFIIVRFNKLNETYLLFAKDLFIFINNNDTSSIPLDYFKTHGYLLEENYHPRINYLKVLEKYGGA